MPPQFEHVVSRLQLLTCWCFLFQAQVEPVAQAEADHKDSDEFDLKFQSLSLQEFQMKFI